MADISVACTLLNLYKEVLDPNFRKQFVNVNRWFVTLINQPQFKAVLGEVKLCAKVAEVDPKKFTQQQGGGKIISLFVVFVFAHTGHAFTTLSRNLLIIAFCCFFLLSSELYRQEFKKEE